MKHTIVLLLFSSLFNCLYAQTKEIDSFYITQFYKDVSEFLVSEKIIEVDSASQSTLLERFENWGGKTFRDYEKVRTSKTESQVTISYIYDESYFIIKAQFKDNKARISIYDDGNTYRPAASSSSPATPARSHKLKYWFDLDKDSPNVIIYKTKEGFFNLKGKRAKKLLNYKTSIDNTILSIEKNLMKTSENAKSDDW